jgi:hypothetical protein
VQTSNQTTTTTSTTTSTSPPPAFTLRLLSEQPDGTPLKGATVQVLGGNNPVTASLPTNITIAGGSTYSLTAGALRGYSFSHWSAGGTTTSVDVSLTSDTTLVAYYIPNGMQTLSVVAKLLDGKSVVGVDAQIIPQHGTAFNDTIPVNLTASYGQTYKIVADSASAVAFKYWNGDSALTNDTFVTALDGNATITAYYQALPIPYKASGSGNHTITVIAHTMDGGLVIGAYFQVRIHGVWNHVADGYSPASVTVPDGSEEVVMYHCSEVANVCSDKFFVYRFWNNTNPVTLTRWQYLNLQSDLVLNSFYEVIPASEAVHVTIEAVTSSGPIFVDCTCGSLVTIANLNGTAVAQSLEPYSFWLWKGETYFVTVGDLPGYTFSGWTTGAKTYTIQITAQPQGDPSDPYYQYFAAIYWKN